MIKASYNHWKVFMQVLHTFQCRNVSHKCNENPFVGDTGLDVCSHVTRYHQDNMELGLWRASRVGATASRTSLNVAGVNLKCQIRSSSETFSFTVLDVVDDLASIAFVFIHIHVIPRSCAFSSWRAHALPDISSGTPASAQSLNWPSVRVLMVVYRSVLDKLRTCTRRNWLMFTPWSIHITAAHSKAIASSFL